MKCADFFFFLRFLENCSSKCQYLEEGVSLSSPSVSDRSVNLFNQNKTVQERRTDLIQCAVGLVKVKAQHSFADIIAGFLSLPGCKRNSSMALSFTSRTDCSRQSNHEY